MPVRIRLQRHGKKGKPFYWIVAADVRSKRDGRYLEKLGVYNPNTNPATVEVDLDGSVKWLESGAQPSDTARTLLSYRGVLLKHHLNGGVKKGALTQEDAQAKIQAKVDGLSKDKASSSAKKLQAETEIREKRISDALAADAAVEEAAAAELEATKAAEAEKAAAEAPAVEEAPATEVVAEAAEEAPVEEVVAEAAKEAPAKEDSAEAKDKE